MTADIRRKKYWIDIRTQGPFLLKIGSIWAGGILLLCVLLYYLADEELGRSFYSIHLRIRNTWQILFPAVLLSGGISYLLTISATLAMALRESHRLGGPIYKFTKLFASLEAGRLDTGFHFRRGDVLFDLGESYRAALQANRDRILALQDLCNRTESRVNDLQAKLAVHPLPPEEKALLEESAVLVGRLREAVMTFDAGTT
jgi:hypothetical protein